MKYLIVSADDFGYSKNFNKKILELIELDLLSSVSVMVDSVDKSQEKQLQKLIYLSKIHNVSIGLHIDFKNKNFNNEIKRQYSVFLELFGFKPSHIDIHKLTYLKDGYPAIQEFSKEKKLPCRNLNRFEKDIMINEVITTNHTTFGGSEKTIDEIETWLGKLDDDFYEIVFHPGYYDPYSKSSLNKEREADAINIERLKPLMKKYKIKLASFFDLMKH